MKPRGLFAGVIAVALGFAGSVAAAPAPLVGASSDAHLWLVTEDADAAVELTHHPRTDDAPTAAVIRLLPRRPAHLAAWRDRVWIIFDPRSEAGEAGSPELYALTVRFNPVSGRHYGLPPDRLAREPRLPEPGTVESLTAGMDGPAAVLRSGDGRRRLAMLRAGGWSAVDLPAAVTDSDDVYLQAAGPRGRRLVLVASSASSSSSSAWAWTADGGWTAFGGDLPEVASLSRVGERLLAVTRDEGTLRLCYLRPSGLLGITTLEPPEAPFGVFGLSDGPRIVTGSDRSAMTMRRIDALGRSVGDARPMIAAPVDAINVLRAPVLLAIAFFVVALAVYLRPPRDGTAPLPAGVEPVSPAARAVALVVDMVPAGVIVLVAAGGRPPDLLDLPLTTRAFVDSLPYIATAVLAVFHGTATELIWDRSLGKLLVAARVTGLDGARPRRAQILKRNAVKLLTLLVPPLAVFVLATPNRQGLDDLAGRTLVVRSARTPSAPVSNDR